MDGFRGYVVRKYFYVFNNMCKNFFSKIMYIKLYL